jgi:hypothetical protein
LTKCINIILDAEKKLNEANGDIAIAISNKLKMCSFEKQRLETITRQ